MKKIILPFVLMLMFLSTLFAFAETVVYTPTSQSSSKAQVASTLSATLKPSGLLMVNHLTPCKLQVVVTNNGDEEYNGVIKIVGYYKPEYPENEAEVRYTNGEGDNITVAPHSDATLNLDVSLYTKDPFEDCPYFYFWVKDKDGNDMASAVKVAIDKDPKPYLVLVGVENNATPNEFENAYVGDSYCRFPKVNDDFALVRYAFRNIGSAGKLHFTISCADPASYNESFISRDYPSFDVPGDKSTFYLEEKFYPTNLGYRAMHISFDVQYLDSEASPWGFVTIKNYMYHLALVEDETKGFTVPANIQILYVAGKSTGLDACKATDGFNVFGGIGELVVGSDKSEQLAVFGIDGRMVSRESVEAGVEKHITLPAGVYIVKGMKVVVR